MASEVAQASHPPQDTMDTSFQDTSLDVPTANGDDAHTSDTMQQQDSNIQGVAANGQLADVGTTIDTSGVGSAAADANHAGPSPVDDVSGGIQPVADFLPKDATRISNPTPPPDELLVSGGADVDVEMGNTESEAQVPAQSQTQLPVPSELVSAQSEQSLVRPREDDADDEPAAKRSRVEEESAPAIDVAPAPTEAVAPSHSEPAAALNGDAIGETPLQTEALAEPTSDPVAESSGQDVKVETAQQDTRAPPPTSEAEHPTTAVTDTPAADQAVETQETAAPSETTGAAATSRYSTEPLTQAQRNFLAEKTKNLKKTKHAVPFLIPVDTVAYPLYPEIVKNMMDIGTMESKLKSGQYQSVQDFANDFDLIISNVRLFNGEAHVVTQMGLTMEAYFRRMMESAPSADVTARPKVEKKRSPSIPREKRRESRNVAAPTPVQPTSVPDQTFALQADGTPQIRRQSSIAGRPARAIKPPQAREIPYAKPKRKEHMLELKFCEHALDEIRSSRYVAYNHAFQAPVDPVALNIPHYRQVIKNPMDLGTMAQKLKQGEYGTAAEFKKDFDLTIKNCLTFNPPGNGVRDMAIELQRNFEQIWAGKDKWERKNRPASTRASSASTDDESADEEDDEDDDTDTAKSAQILALQKELAAMQNRFSAVLDSKPAKAKKSKASKSSSKRGAGLPSAPAKSKGSTKPAPKAKKPRQVTYEDKQEISEAVGKMSEGQVAKLTDIITQNCSKYRDMDEMELEIDDLPNEVQLLLLNYVRGIFGNPNKKKARELSPEDAAALDDDDFQPADKGGRAGKRKKHRPMGKKEQQETIDSIQQKLQQFHQHAASGSESPANSSFNHANAQAESSPDEESEESEEE